MTRLRALGLVAAGTDVVSPAAAARGDASALAKTVVVSGKLTEQEARDEAESHDQAEQIAEQETARRPTGQAWPRVEGAVGRRSSKTVASASTEKRGLRPGTLSSTAKRAQECTPWWRRLQMKRHQSAVAGWPSATRMMA